MPSLCELAPMRLHELVPCIAYRRHLRNCVLSGEIVGPLGQLSEQRRRVDISCGGALFVPLLLRGGGGVSGARS